MTLLNKTKKVTNPTYSNLKVGQLLFDIAELLAIFYQNIE